MGSWKASDQTLPLILSEMGKALGDQLELTSMIHWGGDSGSGSGVEVLSSANILNTPQRSNQEVLPVDWMWNVNERV